MLWQNDHPSITFLTTTFVCVCLMTLAMENFMPKQNIDKVMVLRLVNKKLTDVNNGSFTNTSSHYYLTGAEKSLLEWYRNKVPEEFVKEKQILENMNTNFISVEDANNKINLSACRLYLEKHKFFTDVQVYKSSKDPTKTLAIVKASLNATCSLLVGNLGSFFDAKELNNYFLANFLTGIQKNFLDEEKVFNDLNFPNTVVISNAILGKTLKANMLISLDRWNKMLSCKSTLLYNPASCFNSTDFNSFSKQTMLDTYGVNYTALDNHFKAKKDEFDRVTKEASPQVNLTNVNLAISHLMARGNLIFVFEKDVYAIQVMLQGSFISNEAIKTRCSKTNIWTERCRTKNIKSVSVYCSGDIRASGADTMTHECSPINIDVKVDNQGLLESTVFSSIGKEITGFPSFTYQVYHWNFYDKQEPPRVPI